MTTMSLPHVLRKTVTFTLLAAALATAGCVSSTGGNVSKSSVSPTQVRYSAGPVRCAPPADAQARRNEVLRLVNSIRSRHGLPKVRVEQRLLRVAQAHACDNAAHASYSHYGSDGSDLKQRLKRQSFRARIAIENTGLGFGQDSQRMVNFWMNSTYHRANLLNPKVKYMGLGVARPDGARTAWVLNMGTPL